MEAFPVASTIDAARNYIDKMNDAEAALATGHRQECLDSVLKFERSGKFSDVQKKGIQEYYSKYSIPIGMAHQLEDLVGYRFEFILDDHKDTPIEQFTAMKREICKRVELLRHIPNAGITIRTSSEFNKPLTFQVNEEHSTEVFHKIEEDLRFRQLARHTPSFQQVYETSVGDAVKDKVPTIPYVFSARDLTKGQRSDSLKVQCLAKDLTKAVVNRPEEMAPTAFYPHSGKPASDKIINNLDTMAKKVGVIRPFQKEYEEVQRQQSEIFPFNEGCCIQASLLCPVNRFWDEIDEGRIFGKAELEDHLGTPITEPMYNKYFNKALDRQAETFMKNEAASEAASKAQGNSRKPHLPSTSPIKFATSTEDESVYEVPSLVKKIAEFREHPDWSLEVEDGINRLCKENRIPIGMGIQMIQVVGRHHEFNIDNSGSMVLRADQEDEKARGHRDITGKYVDPGHRSRMDELKSLLSMAGKFLSYLPTKGVTISSMFDPSGTAADAYTTIPVASNHPQFLRIYEETLRTIKPVGNSTPSNQAAKNVYARANSRAEITNTIFCTDGQPTDNSLSFDRSHRAPPGSSIVSSQPIREFINLLANRDPKKIPVTIAQTTNNAAAVAWTNLCDNVCKNVNSIDDKDNETQQVRAHHGKNFPYDRNTYVMSLLLGNDNKLFDGLDEDGIFSKVELETLYGHPMSKEDYDHYFDEAYALQCAPGTAKVKSVSVSEYDDWSRKSSRLQPKPESSSGSAMRGRLMRSPAINRAEAEEYFPLRDAEGASGSSTPENQGSTSKKSKNPFKRFLGKK